MGRKNYSGLMEFTYKSYEMMLKKIRDKGYSFKSYENWNEEKRTVILRHDVDFDLEKAVRVSDIEMENDIEGATYFLLLSTNFYNIHSRESRQYIERIINNGGNIGLHFDEMQYVISDEKEMSEYVYKEIEILEKIIDTKVGVVSMHRPSEKIISGNIKIDGVINSYSDTFFKEMKYLSDSRRYWRENIDEILEGSEVYERFHILTHPFWYKEEEKSLKHTLMEAVLGESLSFWDNMSKNFRDLESELSRDEIERVINVGWS